MLDDHGPPPDGRRGRPRRAAARLLAAPPRPAPELARRPAIMSPLAGLAMSFAIVAVLVCAGPPRRSHVLGPVATPPEAVRARGGPVDRQIEAAYIASSTRAPDRADTPVAMAAAAASPTGLPRQLHPTRKEVSPAEPKGDRRRQFDSVWPRGHSTRSAGAERSPCARACPWFDRPIRPCLTGDGARAAATQEAGGPATSSVGRHTKWRSLDAETSHWPVREHDDRVRGMPGCSEPARRRAASTPPASSPAGVGAGLGAGKHAVMST